MAEWCEDNTPAYKLFIQDIINCTKNNDGWEINFGNSSEPKELFQFQIQVTVIKLTGFENEIMIVTDGTAKAKVTRGKQVPGNFNWLQNGSTCSIVGILKENGKLPHIDVVKLAPVENPVQKDVWSFEVNELKNFLAKRVAPRLDVT